MSSTFVYKKIPYQGSLLKIKELIKNHHWNIEIKVSEEGTLLTKIPKSIEDEIYWFNGENIDEKTNTKFGTFISINETDYEEGKNIELDILNKEEKENEIKSENNKKNKNKEYKRQISEILLNGDTAPEENKKSYGLNFIIQQIDLNELSKNIEKNYIDQYDYFFSQNHIFMCIFLALILLVIFNF